MGKLQKMRFVAYDDDKFKKKRSENYTAMLNPESLKIDREITYAKQQEANSSEPSPKYKYSAGSNISFDLILDCTGVVDPKRTDFSKEIKQLQGVIYNYEGVNHRPNFIKIFWGKGLNFQGVLLNYDVSYNLFRPDGTPLRAKISLKFSSYKAPEVVAKEEGKSSPDMSHIIDVVEGDTLPQLAEKVWSDTAYTIPAAKFNQLNKFRKLQARSRLIFPPLIPA